MGSGLRLLSGGLRLFAARDSARSRSEEDDEEAARGAGSHRRRLAAGIDVSLALRCPGLDRLHPRVPTTPDRGLVLGDARVEMERGLAAGMKQHFEVLVIDAFSGDAAPTHLMGC